MGIAARKAAYPAAFSPAGSPVTFTRRLGGGEDTFLPTNINGLLLYLLGDTGLYSDAGSTAAEDTDPVQEWHDQSGNGNNATQITLSKRGTYDAANQGVVIDAVDDFFDLDSTINLTTFTCFALVKLASEITAATSGKPIFNAQATGAGSDAIGTIALGNWAGGIANERVTMWTSDATTATGAAENTANIAAGNRLFTASLSGTTEALRLDGADLTLSDLSGGSMDSSDAGKTWNRLDRIGNYFTGTYPFGDTIKALLIYDSALSAADIASVESYLSDYFSLGL